jgi:hypothetical protein
MTASRIQVGASQDYLNTNLIRTSAGEVHNEVVEVQPSLAFSTTDLLGNAETYDSGVLDLRSYTQVQTNILSVGASGTITIDFVQDAAGSDILQTLSIPYTDGDGYSTFSSIAFTPYVRYRFTTSGAGQTDFYFDTKFTQTALSAQILGVNSFITPAMVSSLTRSVVVGQTEGGDFKNVPVDSQGKFRVSQPLTAFGELQVAQKTPEVQLKFSNGILTDQIDTLVNKTGSTVTEDEGTLTVTVAGAAEAFSQIRSKDVVRYQPGIGVDCKFTAAFSAGLADSSLLAGLGDDDEFIGVGYVGTQFGISYKSFGELEVRELIFTQGGDADGGTFTLTVDNTAITITVPAGSATIADVVALCKAASDDFAAAGRGWEIHIDDSKRIRLVSMVAEAADGTFSFADVDSGVTATAGWTTARAGAVPETTFVAQTAWNVDPMDGTGPSGMTLTAGADLNTLTNMDPAFLNVWDISMQYPGNVNVYLESRVTGEFEKVHQFTFAGSRTKATFRNPSFNTTIIAQTDAGFSGAAQTIKTSSMAGFVEGVETTFGIRKSKQHTLSSNGTTEVCGFVMHNNETFNSHRNKVIAYPDFLSLINESTRSVSFRLVSNPTHIDAGATLVAVDAANSVIQTAGPGGIIQGGEELSPFSVPANSSVNVDIKQLDIKISPRDTLVIAFTKEAGGTDGNVTVGLSWVELI